MSICKEIVDLMGGTVDVQSNKGTGTTVTVTIKFQKGTKEQLPEKEVNNVDTSVLKGKRVLVADDNEMNRLVACYMLTSYEVVIVEAKNGKEAVDKIQAEPFDIVLMDIQMPEMDGIEAVKIIRESISKTLPVIALTAMALKGDDKKFIEAGMSDYVSKPFNENQLLQVLIKNLQEQLAETKTALYDLSKLHAIANGNQAFIEKMVNLFLLQGPASVEEIKEAYKNKNIEQVKKVAHRLKPSIDNMGVVLLRDIIRNIEHPDTTNPEKLSELIQQLETNMNEVVSELKRFTP
jgi:CheY-like chemotaxis protein